MSDFKKVLYAAGTVAVMYAMAALLSCYDHLHPPVTPGGDPTQYPPLTDSKADAGRG
jgi:hypothetical protein